MGCTHSRSEDLRQRSSLLHSQSFMDSLEDVPGYFNKTLTATHYLSSEFPSAHTNKPEMSFHGPPSHLQNSEDVHPFWFEYGRDYHPKERFIDRSRSMEAIPTSLLPGTGTAQEMRDIEIRETMQNLRRQVRDVWTNKIDEVDGEDANLTSFSSSDVDQNMTQEEKSTIEFFESMINESVDFDSDGQDTVPIPQQDYSDSEDKGHENDQSWRREPSLTSLLPGNLDRPMVGHVHGVVTEGRYTPTAGSPHRTVPSNYSPSRTAALQNGHASFLKNNVYLPKENSITSYHRNPSSLSPSRKAPPPPTKPKPKRGSGGNKRYSYPMTASQPTEFGANFLIANRSSQGSQLTNGNYGNHQNGSPHNSSISEDMGIVSDVTANNEQNAGVRNIVHRFNQSTHHQQPRHSQSFKQQSRGPQFRDERTPQKGFRHSMYPDTSTPYGYNNNIGINGNKNNSNEVASGARSKRRLSDDAMSDDSAVDVRKDTTPEDVVLHGIEADLLHLQLT